MRYLDLVPPPSAVGAGVDVGAILDVKVVRGAMSIISAISLCSAAVGAMLANGTFVLCGAIVGAIYSVGIEDFSLGCLACNVCTVAFVGAVLEEVGFVLPLDSALRH